MRDGTCPLYPHLEPGFRGMVAPQPTDGLVQYACVTCGYLETHVAGEDAIAFIRARWPAVPPAPKS